MTQYEELNGILYNTCDTSGINILRIVELPLKYVTPLINVTHLSPEF